MQLDFVEAVREPYSDDLAGKLDVTRKFDGPVYLEA